MKQFKKLGLSKRQARKFRKLLATCAAFAALSFSCAPAQAEPVTGSIATALMYFVGYDTAVAIAAAVVAYAANVAITYAVGAMTPSAHGGYSSSALGDRTHMVRSSVSPRSIVYGRSMVSGPLAFIGTSNRGDGTNGVGGATIKGGENAFLHLIVMLANHEIDAVEEVYLGDEPLGFSTMVNNKPVGGKFGGIVSQGEAFTSTVTLPANATSITIGNQGASAILGLVEVGAAPATAPGGGEGGTDAFGNPILPNGGTANIDTTYTFVNANTVTTPAVNRSRNMALTYVSAGIASSYVDCYAHLGSPSQTANAALMAACPDKWTSAHRLQGIAYLYVRLLYNTKVFPNGIPNIKALIRGAKVRDPRKANYPSDTPAWTANYALCALDYLKSTDGLGCVDSDLDLEQIKVAANVCDEVVTIRPTTGSQGTVTLAMYQKRYEANGVILLDHDVEENLRSLSTAGGGPVPLLVSGRFQIPVGYYGTPNVFPLTATDLRAAVKVRPRSSRRDLFNAVGGTYVDGRISWQPTDFPEVANSLYKANDGGEKIRRDITLPFTTDEMMAQRLAKIMLERSRQAITIEWPGKPSCFRVAINDLVPVTLSKFGWNAKVFRCVGWSMQSNGSVDLVLQEDAPGIYDWNYGAATTTDLSKDTDLPDPSYIAPMGALTLYSDSSELVRTGDGTIVSRLHVIWPATADAGIVNGGEFQVQYKKASDTYWTPWDKVSGAFNETWIFPVVDTEVYFVRARAVNNRGIETDWVYAKHKIIGNTAPPPNVAGFTVSVRADGTRSFAWTTSNQPVNVTTGGGYRIKYRPAASTAPWSTMTPLHNGLLSQSPLQIADPVAGDYDFGIVAVNASRVESNTPAMVNDATIGREPVMYAASANLLFNSDWQLSNNLSGTASLFGWEFDAGNTPSPPIGMGRHFDVFTAGRGGAWIRTNNLNVDIGYYTSIKQKVIVQPGYGYEISVLAAPQRCAVQMRMDWYTSGGTLISSSPNQFYNAGAGGVQTNGSFENMILLWDYVTAPANAAYGYFSLYKFGTTPGQPDSFAFWNRAMMCVARPGVSRATATPWIEAGIDQLHGGTLQDLSVDSKQIANEAATTILSQPNDNPVTLVRNTNAGPWTGINSIGYTATVACEVTVLYEATMANAISQAPVNGTYIDWGAFLQLGYGAGFNDDPDIRAKTYFNEYQSGNSSAYTVRGQRKFSMAAGQYIGLYLSGAGGISGANSGNTTNIYCAFSRIQVEAVKK